MVRALREHFGTELRMLPIVTEAFDAHDHPNVHLAIEGYLTGDGRSAELLGISSDIQWMEITFSQLITGGTPGSPMAVADGPVQYTNLTLSEGEVITCVQRGLYLIRDRDERMALLVRGPTDFGGRRQVSLEVMSRDRTAANAVLVAIRAGSTTGTSIAAHPAARVRAPGGLTVVPYAA